MNALKRLTATPLRAALCGALVVSAPLALTLPTIPAAAQGQGSQLDQAVRALRGITTMRADFTQTDRNGNSVAGTLTLKNPGKIRFEYSKDVNMLVVSNGTTLNMIDYDVQQVERWPIRNSPISALLDPGQDLARYGKVVPTANNNVVSIAVSDPDKPEYPEITLIFVRYSSAPGGLELASWVALDAQNTRTTVRLLNHRYGIDVPNSTFTFRDPRGTSRRPG